MFTTKLFRAALAPLAFTAALASGQAAQAQAIPYTVFAYAVGGPITDPCSVMYAIAPTGTARYTAANGYTPVRAAGDRATAQQFMLLFSKHHNNQPDGVVKLAPCTRPGLQIGSSTGPGPLTNRPCRYLKRYSGLMHKFYSPRVSEKRGSCSRYGYWRGTQWAGQPVQPGYWVYANGYWYVFRDRAGSDDD